MADNRKILIVNKEDKTTEISSDDEIIWQGYIEDADTLEEILSSLDFEVERIDHSMSGDMTNKPEIPEDNYYELDSFYQDNDLDDDAQDHIEAST